MSDAWGLNLDLSDFDSLLMKDDLVEIPVDINTFVTDSRYLGLNRGLSEKQTEIALRMTQIFKPSTLIQLYGEEEGLAYYKKYNVNEVICMLGKGSQDRATPIFNPQSGKWERLDSFTNYNNTVIGYTDGELKEEYCTQAFMEDIGKMLLVKTSLGFQERVYEGHRYYTWKTKDFYKRNTNKSFEGPQWTQAKDLVKGDKIAIGAGFDVIDPQDIPISHARFLAYLIGDGCCPTDSAPHINVDFGGDEIESLQQYIDAIEDIGSTYSLTKHATKNMNFVRHRPTSKAVELAKHYGLWDKRAHDKEIPEVIWKCSNKLIQEFLGALWSTDGCVYIKHSKKTSHAVAEYCTISEKLAIGIQRLLLRLGIPSTLRDRIPKYTYLGEKKEGQRAYYVTVQTNEIFPIFAAKIPLLDYKREKVNEGLQLIENSVYTKQMFDQGLYWTNVKSVTSDGEDEYWTMTQPNSENYIGNGLLSAQSGKDHTSRIAFAYVAYLLHCLRDPLDYFGKSHGVTIDLLNVAVNSQQANNVFFEPLKKLLLASPYFNEMGFEPRSKEIFFFQRPIRMFSGHSESEGWEGYELLLVVLDEIAAFKTDIELKGETRSRGSASAIYEMSHNSVASRFPDVGKVILLSFPRFRNDFITTRYADYERLLAAGEADYVWGMKAATWEVNPTKTREEFEPAFKRNPVEARARFMSIVAGEKVWSDKGLQNIEDIKVGQLVNTRFGSKKVLDAWVQPQPKPCVLITFKTGETLRCSEDHPLLKILYTRKSTWAKKLGKYQTDWIAANKLDIGSKCLGHFDSNLFGNYNVTQNQAYLLGLILGDGNIKLDLESHGRRYAAISCGKHLNFAQEIHAMFFQEFGSCHIDTLHGNKLYPNNICYSVRTDKTSVVEQLYAFGMRHVPAQDKRIPETVFQFAEDKIKSFISGFIDADGSIRKEGQVSLVSTSIALLQDFQLLFGALGCRGTISLNKKAGDNGLVNSKHDLFVLRFNKYNSIKITNWLELKSYKKEFTIPVSYSSDRYKDQLLDLQVESITDIGLHNVYDIHVDEVQEFVCNNIVVHNCEPPEMEDPFFREPELVRACFRHADNPVDELDGTWKPWFNGTDAFPRFIHIDLGLKRDKTALTMVHMSGLKEVNTMAGIEKLPIINIDFVKSWKAEVGTELNFADVRATIQQLGRLFPIAKITFDMWSSADMIQTLRSWGYNSEWHTVRKTDYDTLQTAFYDGRVRGYWNEQLVEHELLQLKLINNKKVDHPSTGEKDIADSLAGAVFQCLSNMDMEQEVEIELFYDSDVAYDDDIIDMVRGSIEAPGPEIPQDLKEWLLETI